MKLTHRMVVSTSALSALLGSLILPRDVSAKLDVPYGEDGAPSDSETQAQVDALNEALEGPEEGQSWQSWEAEFEQAYTDLFGAPASSNSSQAADEVVLIGSEDLCRDPLDVWLPGKGDETVASALAEPAVRSQLTAQLESYLHWILLMETAGTGIEFDPPEVTSLVCSQCSMTYAECLEAGYPWDFCKRRYLTCPTEPSSSISVALTVTGPATGSITASGTVSSEVSLYAGVEYTNYCFNLRDYQFDGFSIVMQALIEANIDRVLGDGKFCLYYF